MFQPRLGISWDPERRRQAGAALQHRAVLRAHSRAEPGQLALDQRQPRPDAVPRQHLQRVRRDPAGLSEPDPAVGDRRPRSSRRVRVRQGLPEPAHVVVDRVVRAGGRWPICRRRSPTRTRTPTTSPGSSTATIPCSGRRGAPAWAPAAPTGSATLDGRREHGPEPLRRRDLRPQQEVRAELPVPGRTTRCRGTCPTTTTSAIRSRSATRGPTRWSPSTTTRTATSGTGSTPGS